MAGLQLAPILARGEEGKFFDIKLEGKGVVAHSIRDGKSNTSGGGLAGVRMTLDSGRSFGNRSLSIDGSIGGTNFGDSAERRLIGHVSMDQWIQVSKNPKLDTAVLMNIRYAEASPQTVRYASADLGARLIYDKGHTDLLVNAFGVQTDRDLNFQAYRSGLLVSTQYDPNELVKLNGSIEAGLIYNADKAATYREDLQSDNTNLKVQTAPGIAQDGVGYGINAKAGIKVKFARKGAASHLYGVGNVAVNHSALKILDKNIDNSTANPHDSKVTETIASAGFGANF